MPASSPLNIVAIGFDSEDEGYSLWRCIPLQPRGFSLPLHSSVPPTPQPPTLHGFGKGTEALMLGHIMLGHVLL